MGTYANSLFSLIMEAICFFVLVLGCSAKTRHNIVCPFDYIFHTGDGFFDVGNAIIRPGGSKLPANRPPYGITNPGYPTGRWSDGILDIDTGGAIMGFPEVTPSLRANASHTAIIFAVAESTILDETFFASRGVTIPSHAASQTTQIDWLREYLKILCSTTKECRDTMANSIFLFGDFEANDIGFPLVQRKSLAEVMTYVPYVTMAQITAARDVIEMGATRVVVTGNAPLGCFPYILTKLGTKHPSDYDDQGCLRSVNEVIKFKNQELQRGVNELIEEFPDLTIVYADMYTTFETVLQDTLSGPNKDVALKTCCGIGGEYNFNSSMVCGTSGVPVCDDPNSYLFWDGIRLTQNGQGRLSALLQPSVIPTFNCTSTAVI